MFVYSVFMCILFKFVIVLVVMLVVVYGIVCSMFYWFVFWQVVQVDIYDLVLIVQGQYLLCVVDCVVCYIVLGGKLFVGGFGMQMLMGMIYLINIIFDLEIGIGVYDYVDFECVVCCGICYDGQLLYLVMLYVFYVIVCDVEIKVLYVYFMGLVQLVKQDNVDSMILWLVNMCWFLVWW